MDIKFIKSSLEKINEIEKILLQIQTPREEEFVYLTKIINEVENNIYFIGNTEDIDIVSTLKKIFAYIERYPYQFFIFKYIIFETLLNFEALYNLYYAGDHNRIRETKEKLQLNIENLRNEFESINKNKDYYYINFTLDKKVPYFYLSRRNILARLREFGKAYNYIPTSLDDDRYSYFILDFKIEKDIDVLAMLENIKNDDEGIVDFKLNKIDNDKNIYNIKIYIESLQDDTISKISNIFEENVLLDIIPYENMLDIYVYGKNQLEILDKITNIDNSEIFLVLSKNINNRETKGIAINGVNKENVDKIRKVISVTLLDKKIVDILYHEPIDFVGKQFLEYLKEKYNIENGLYTV
ncbi:PALP domain-containing protein [Streptobacillus canis]|uniref:hypothetical protein n=1 Tax=Streptobacillus canis TaxID=2678686 RepID=UPI0012E31702|nr:hypothetical protein [Streptobacillus canis]